MFGDYSYCEEYVDLLRGALPYYTVIVLPILILLSPYTPVQAVTELSVARLQHYDLQTAHYGCRSGAINAEAGVLESGTYSRQCILTRLLQLTPAKYREVIAQGALGMVVIVPKDRAALDSQQQERILEAEQFMLEEETPIPVYFVEESTETEQLYERLLHAGTVTQSPSAAHALLQSVMADGVQLVVSSPQPKSLPDIRLTNIHGRLPGLGIEEQLSTIAFVAHYDSFSVAPALTIGADSNGSGVAALLELARLFSRLYSNSRTHAKYNVIFLLSAGGKINFQGTKRWIEDNLDSTDSSLLQDVLYTICLDTIGAGDELYLHVSKPPRDGTPGAHLLRELTSSASQAQPPVRFHMLHKKINLAEETLAWEHERFSMRRLPAFTLSRLAQPRVPRRNSLLDDASAVNVKRLTHNVQILAEAVTRQLFNVSVLSEELTLSESLKVSEYHLKFWLDILTRQSRATQFLVETARAPHPIVSALQQGLARYVRDVKASPVVADKREPEFMFYDALTATLNVYSVKPAVFDLILTGVIVAYLGIFYLVLLNFHILPSALRKAAGSPRMKLS